MLGKVKKMYARVFVSLLKKPEMIEDHLQVIKDMESIVEMQYPDLRDVFHLVDRNSGKIINIFFWETEAAANRLQFTDLDGQLGELLVKGLELLAVPPTDEIYEALL